MRSVSIFALLIFASPALAHSAPVAHGHAEWALPLGIALIAAAATGAVIAAKVRK